MSYEIDPAYREVPDRWASFRERHPDAYMTSEIVGLYELESGTFIAVKAYVYTSKDDDRPATGLAWEPIPGRTPFTRDSELMNAETSAWGRALVAHGEAAKDEKFASAHEVRMRQQTPPTKPAKAKAAKAAEAAAPADGGLVAPWATKGKWKTNPNAVLRIVELGQNPDGSWPQVCPYCLSDVEATEIGGKPGWKCTNWRDCDAGTRRPKDSHGNPTRADSRDGWWAWSAFQSDDVWEPHGRVSSLVAYYSGELTRTDADPADVPDSPTDFWPPGEEPFE